MEPYQTPWGLVKPFYPKPIDAAEKWSGSEVKNRLPRKKARVVVFAFWEGGVGVQGLDSRSGGSAGVWVEELGLRAFGQGLGLRGVELGFGVLLGLGG